MDRIGRIRDGVPHPHSCGECGLSALAFVEWKSGQGYGAAYRCDNGHTFECKYWASSLRMSPSEAVEFVEKYNAALPVVGSPYQAHTLDDGRTCEHSWPGTVGSICGR